MSIYNNTNIYYIYNSLKKYILLYRSDVYIVKKMCICISKGVCMEKINYQILCEARIAELQKQNKRPRLLLHTCCGPCSSYVLEYLSQYFAITVYYYNPNIDTAHEHALRIQEQAALIDKMHLDVQFVGVEYEPKIYYQAVKGLENEREGGKRCDVCFMLRLEKSAQYAKEHGFDYFTTSLSISPLKNSQKLNNIGKILEEKYGVRYLESDFKKRGGYQRSVVLSKKYNMYRQDYCGCIFSKNERMQQIQNATKQEQNS